jgi:hypothetical protein
MPLIIMLPGRSDDRMFAKVAVLPPQAMDIRSSLFMPDKGFKGLLKSNAYVLFESNGRKWAEKFARQETSAVKDSVHQCSSNS